MDRIIRLKEWGCNKSTFKRPSEKQLLLATEDLEDKDYPLNTDANGFIIDAKLKCRADRCKNIVLLGDSFVESVFVDEDKRINAVLEGLAPGFNVLNGGYSGATSLHLVNVIINKVVPVDPEYVVVFVPTNDQRVQAIESGYWNSDARLSPLIPLRKGEVLAGEYFNHSKLKSVEKMLKLVHLALENFSIPHCFVTTPHRQQITEKDIWLRRVGGESDKYLRKVTQRKRINSVCRDFCRKFHVDYVDLEFSIRENNEYFYDDLHLTNASAPVVGALLFEGLKDLGVF